VDERPEVVEIDLTGVNTADELQSLLMDRLGFPGWYGCNWNAFWDAITGLVAMPRRLRLSSFAEVVRRPTVVGRGVSGALAYRERT
jgi:RNAse (barnase) inhibitor barstar